MCQPSIPDSIYNNRCRYCMHFTGLPNTTGELSTGQLLGNRYVTPCKIISIAEYCDQKVLSYKPFSCTYKVHTDECFSFTPNFGYPGICKSCRHFDLFQHKTNYCELPKEEIADRRPLLIGHDYNRRETSSWTYAYHTCSKWQIKDLWYNTAVRDTAEGKLPMTWDPNTRKLICNSEPDPKVLDIWAQKHREIVTEKDTPSAPAADDGQISFFN